MTDEKRYVLEDLEVKEVSVVDRGANKRVLLMVKNGDPMPTDETVTETAATESDPVVEAQAEKAKDTTELIVGLPADMRDAMAKMLTEVSARVGILGEAVKAATDGEGGVTDKFKNEVMGLSNALRMLASAEKADDIAAVEKGVLMGAPTPMAQGYGVPMMDAAPEYVMTAEGPMMKMPVAAMKAVACKYAMDQMYKAEEMLAKEDYSGCCACIYVCLKAIGPFVPEGGGMPQQMAYAMKMLMEPKMMEAMKQYAYNQPQPSIAAGVPDAQMPAHMEQPGSGSAPADELAKAGRKIAGAKLTKLEELLAQLSGVVAELRPTETVKTESDADAANLKDKIIALAKLAKAQQATIDRMNATRPTGHALPYVEADDDNSPAGKVLWPDDLNDLSDSDL